MLTLAQAVQKALITHFDWTPSEPAGPDSMVKGADGRLEWNRPGEPVEQVIAEHARIDAAIAQDVRLVLAAGEDGWHEEGPFDESAKHERILPRGSREWSAAVSSLVSGTRFFNRDVEHYLRLVFRHIDEMKTDSGKCVVRKAGPRASIQSVYRARRFQDKESLMSVLADPENELGPPPPGATSPGRMNAKGVSVFYGALESGTAMAEVRPSLGGFVLVGRFSIHQHLRLLDVSRLREVRSNVSIFHPLSVEKMTRARALEHILAQMSEPVHGEPGEFEYLPTQIVSDFLGAQEDLALDGLLYPSIQCDGGVNMLLFGKSCKMRQTHLIPTGTVAYEQDSDGAAGTYTVKNPKLPEHLLHWPDEGQARHLALDRDSLRVHEIQSIQFETAESMVLY